MTKKMACMLHRDYHELQPECIAVALDWLIAREHMPYERRFEYYQQEVEGRMLEDVWGLGRAR